MITPLFPLVVNAATPNQTRYYAFNSGAGVATSTTIAFVRVPVPTAGTVSQLQITLSAAPGVGESYAFTLVINGVASSLTKTLSGSTTTDSDLVNAPSISPGDTVVWQVIGSTAAAATNITLGAIFTSTNSAETLITGACSTSAPNSAANYMTVLGGGITTTESLVSMVVPTNGTLDNFYAEASSTPSPGSYAVTIYQNGAGSALTVNLTTGAIVVDNTHSVSVTAGDVISIELNPSSTPTARIIKIGVRFKPTIDGESVLMMRATAWSNAGARFHSPQGNGANTATETTVQAIVPVAFTLKNLYARVNVAPTGATKSWTARSRKNTANGNLNTAIVDTAVNNQDTTNSDSYALADLINWSTTPANTPAVIGKGDISAVMYIAPPAGGFTSIPDMRLAFI